jgi:hypothetical protein
MKNSSSIKSITFVLWFVMFCSMRYYASTDKNIISTIKKASANFTYRILPADVKPLCIIKVEDADIKMEVFVKSTDKIVISTPPSKINHMHHSL